MTATPNPSDPFGYDEAGRPVAVKLTSNVYAFGQEFCEALQALMKHGCRSVTRLTGDGKGTVFVYHPPSRKTEVWSGPWKEDEPKVFSIIDPKHVGMLARTFYDFDDMWAFAERDLTNLELVRGQLPVPRNG